MQRVTWYMMPLRIFEKPAFILITTLLTSDGRLLDGEGMVKFIEKLGWSRYYYVWWYGW